MKIHQMRSACSKNPPNAKCLIRKPTNYSVSRLQLMDFWKIKIFLKFKEHFKKKKHFAVGGFSG